MFYSLFATQDTEFPGVVARPIGQWKSTSEYHYQTMRCNVDLLKIIQVGITLADAEGNMPPEPSTWQFNFRFSIKCVLWFYQSEGWLTRVQRGHVLPRLD